ncbi:hypothetical protein MHM39_06855 [Phaeobacter sp. CNT1-3]|nr:hypothetical protein [Phaeobacter sp. CNT1-3]
MFTNAKLELAELAKIADFHVVRNAEVSYAGKVPTRLDRRVVPAAAPNHIEAAIAISAPGSEIAALIVPENLADMVPETFGLGVAAQPQQTVARIQEHLAQRADFQWQSFETHIAPGVSIAPGAYIAPRDVVIEAGCTIGPNASILPRSIIGPNCHIGAGTVIGMDAFDQMPGAQPRRLIRQSGGVRLERDVTIAANCSVSRSTFGGFASIGAGTLIDANVYIAHDAKIGRDVTICSSVSLSGRVTLEDKSYIGPQAAVSNGITIGASATVSIGAVVTRSVPSETRVTGNFALPHEQWLDLVRDYRST